MSRHNADRSLPPGDRDESHEPSPRSASSTIPPTQVAGREPSRAILAVADERSRLSQRIARKRNNRHATGTDQAKLEAATLKQLRMELRNKSNPPTNH